MTARRRQLSAPSTPCASLPPPAVFELARALARKLVADQDRARDFESRTT